MTTRVLVTGTSVRADLLQPLVDAGLTIDNPTHLLSEDELRQRLSSSVAYLLGGDEKASRAALSSAKDLKIVAFLGVGYESFVDATAARDFGIRVTNTPGTLTNSVAEFTIGHLLNCTRRLFLYATEYAAGQAGKEQKQHDLADLHVGIIGLGAIGTRIAEVLRNGFGSRVSYYSRTRKPQTEERLGVAFVSLGDLMRMVEVVVVMTPANEQTKGLVGAAEISSAQPGLILINTARAEIVDPRALLAGLESEQLGYASFDGLYDSEPTLTKSLKAFIPAKLMVTGHIGSLTHEARDGMAKKAVQSILNVLKNGRDEYVVNGV